MGGFSRFKKRLISGAKGNSSLKASTSTAAASTPSATAVGISTSVQNGPAQVSGTTVLPSPSGPSVTGNSVSRWEAAFKVLSDEQRKRLQLSNPTGSVDKELERVQQTKDDCVGKQKTVRLPDGRIVIVRDKVHVILKKVQQYIVIVDTAIQHHPETIALVWAGVRFCLQLALDEMETFEKITSFLEEIANIMGSCRIYERLYSSGVLESARAVMKALPALYVAVLGFIAEANYYFSTASGKRVAQGITKPFVIRFQSLIEDINGKRTALDSHARLAHMDIQQEMSGEQLQEFRKLSSQLSAFQRDILQVQTDIRKVLLHVEGKIRMETLDWISNVRFGDHHEETKKHRFAGTGEWLFDKSQYRDWMESDSSSILWLRGKAGSGKTVLSSLVIDALRGTQEISVPIIFFYCNYKEKSRREASSILRTLLKQLSAQFLELHQDLVVSYQKAQSEGHSQTSLSSYQTETLIKVSLSRFKTIFIVVDALDECEVEERKHLVKFLIHQIQQHETPNGCCVKIFFTSRDEPDLQCLLKEEGTQKYAIDADDTAKDIRPFVRDEVIRSIDSGEILGGNVSQGLREDLIKSLIDNADGMFLWVKYQLLQLSERANERELRNQLKKPPRGLDSMYKEIWTKIGAMDDAQKNWAYKFIKWILSATRPLNAHELLEATSIEQGDTSFDESKKASDVTYLMRVCKHLVIQDKNGDLRFMHYSVQEFVTKQSEMQPLNDIIAETCLTALKICNSSLAGIYDYATMNWEKHVREWTEINDSRAAAIEGFLLDESRVKTWVKTKRVLDPTSKFGEDMCKYFGYELYHDNPTISPPEMSAYFGLRELLNYFMSPAPLEKKPRFTILEPSKSLFIAVFLENAEFVELLLKAGANPNANGARGVYEKYESILQAAVSWRCCSPRGAEVVKLLINAGAKVNAQGGRYGSILQEAIATATSDEAEAPKVVQLLLNAGADVNAQGGEYGNALQAAAVNQNVKLVELLLDAGADVNAQGGYYGNALQAVLASKLILPSKKTHEIVELLLDAGADLNAQGGYYGNALQAAIHKNVKFVELLLDAGVDVNTPGGHHGNAYALQAAAHENEEVVELLLNAGADINAQGGYYGNALQAAVALASPPDEKEKRVKVVGILLKAGANVNAQGGYYGNALQAAVHMNDNVVELLLKAGADINAQGGEYGNALQAASSPFVKSENMINVINLLINAGADVNAQGGRYGNALQAALLHKNDDVGELLLKAGADINAQGGEYGNALQAAAAGAYKDRRTIELLLKSGVDVNAQGGYYGNALQAAAGARPPDDINKVGEAVKLLLDAGADVNAQGGYFGNALQAAAASSPFDPERATKTVEILLNAGADVNAQGRGLYGSALKASIDAWNPFVEKQLRMAGAEIIESN